MVHVLRRMEGVVVSAVASYSGTASKHASVCRTHLGMQDITHSTMACCTTMFAQQLTQVQLQLLIPRPYHVWT